MLGSALIKKLISTDGISVLQPRNKILWGENERAKISIKKAITEFSIASKKFQNWQIFWAAGKSTMHSSNQELTAETEIIRYFIDQLEHEKNLDLSCGTFIFSSSAGAVYGGNQDSTIDEDTKPCPINPYGDWKLRQEEVVCKLNRGGCRILIARISTLFGTGQSQNKKQGLLTEIARKTLRNELIHIYVPLQTMRDYISADDAANIITKTALHKDIKGHTVKIIASEYSTSIAEIIGIFKKLIRKNFKIITKYSPSSTLYKRCTRFKSIVIPIGVNSGNNLISEISKLIHSEQRSLGEGVPPNEISSHKR